MRRLRCKSDSQTLAEESDSRSSELVRSAEASRKPFGLEYAPNANVAIQQEVHSGAAFPFARLAHRTDPTTRPVPQPASQPVWRTPLRAQRRGFSLLPF